MYPATTNYRFGYFWVTWIALTLAAIVAAGMGMHPSAPVWASKAALGVWLTLILPLAPIAMVQRARTSFTARGFVVAGWLTGMVFVVFMIGMAAIQDYLVGEQLTAGAFRQFISAAVFASVGVVMGLLIFSAPGREFAKRFLPINPRSFTDVTALATAVPVIVFCFLPLVLYGQPPKAHENDTIDSNVLLAALLGQLIWVVALTLFAAGFPLVRNWQQTMKRLGIGRISAGGFCVAIGVALIMLGGVPLLGVAAKKLWDWLGWPTTDERHLNELFGFAMTGTGAIVIGLTAGISEEILCRGLLQPKFGLWFTNILFAAGHALQYNWDGVVMVFLIGVVCGLVRQRYNTVASMITHGLYDTLLVLLTIWLGN